MSDALRCQVCNEDAIVFCPGTEGIAELFVLVRGTPDRMWCLQCARLCGWPWVRSEAVMRARA